MAEEAGLTKWVRVALDPEGRQAELGALRDRFGLEGGQVGRLVLEGSPLGNIVLAINSSISLKTQDESLCSGEICSNEDLAVYQFVRSGLTNQTILPGISLNSPSIL
jgi:hypothetical protein